MTKEGSILEELLDAKQTSLSGRILEMLKGLFISSVPGEEFKSITDEDQNYKTLNLELENQKIWTEKLLAIAQSLKSNGTRSSTFICNAVERESLTLTQADIKRSSFKEIQKSALSVSQMNREAEEKESFDHDAVPVEMADSILNSAEPEAKLVKRVKEHG